MVIRTVDQGAAARALLRGMELREMPEGVPGGVMVPPEQAGGCAVVFA
jgi:hypothetical protein